MTNPGSDPLKVCSQGTAVAAIFFAAANGLHWIQCECSHCAAASVPAAAVPHKMSSEPILCGCSSGIMREVQIMARQNHSNFSNFWTFRTKIQINLMSVLVIK